MRVQSLYAPPPDLTPVAPQRSAPLSAAETPVLLVELMAAVLSTARFDEAAIRLVNELATRLSCERVSLGFRKEAMSRVTAISHHADFRESQNLLRDIASAMDEALDQGASVHCPADAKHAQKITHAHLELLSRHGNHTALSVPIADDGRLIGALTLERTQDAFDADTIIQAEHIASLIGPLLELKRAPEAPLVRVCLQRVYRRYTQLFGGHLKISYVLSGLALIFALLAFVPATYHIGSPARLEGAVQRVMVAPTDGFLRRVNVRPGDSVAMNQVVAELEQEDMALEQRKWQSEMSQIEKEFGNALAKQDRAELAITRARLDQARAQSDLASENLKRAHIKAPFDGLVLEGDLSQSLGAPVKRGDVLMTVAPRQRFRVILEVDENDIADVRAGQQGRLALTAHPGEPMAFVVKRISPVAIARDGRNFFEVEAALAGRPPLLNPGLKGVGKIDAGRQPLLWIGTHRLVDWIRFRLW